MGASTRWTGRSTRRWLCSLTALLALAGFANASTWIVDIAGGPGAHFAQIRDALAASQAGDTIRIRPGTYLPLNGADKIQKGVTLIGEGTVDFGLAGSWVEVDSLPAGEALVIANITGNSWLISNCQGSVTLRESRSLFGISVQQCSDVRVQSMTGTVGPVGVLASRLELTDCTLQGNAGSSGQSCNPLWPATPGGAGLSANNGSVVHFVRSSAFGGTGGDGPSPGVGGAGASISGSTLILDGGGASTLRGGPGGLSDFCVSFNDAQGGPGLFAHASTIVRWGAALQGGGQQAGGNGAPGLPLVLGGGATDQVLSPESPLLSFDRAPVAGGTVILAVRAPPGTVVRLNFGRVPRVISTPGLLVEGLLWKAMTVDLGTVPPSGVVHHRLRISPHAHPGDRLYAQAQAVYPTLGEVRRSASALLLVR